MTSAALGTALRQIHRLFSDGTVAALPDEQLLSRFAAARDEASFEALVARHGPLVLAVCRSVLKDEHDAEDAFQATFLVFARKAGSLWVRDSLGAWLHRVAYRIALRANADRRERRTREASMPARPEPHGTWDDWLPVLHQEIDRLPHAQRDPIVLCDLQELTYEQAARQLRLTVPALRSRLARGRERLRLRLTRRGMTGAGLAVGSLAASHAFSASVPAAWSRRVVEAAIGGPLASSAASILAAATLRAMLVARLKLVATVAAGMAVLVTLGFYAVAGPGGEDGESHPKVASPPASAAAPAGDETGTTVDVRGLVVDPQGRPVRGATLRLDHFMFLNDPPRDGEPTATTNPDGRFVFSTPRDVINRMAEGRAGRAARVVASAPGFGPGWAEAGPSADALHDVTIRLVEDDVPVEGRVLDLEGRPVAGAVIETSSFFDPRSGDLAPWIEAFKAGQTDPYVGLEEMPIKLIRTTGPDGRFRLEGIGRERVVMFTVSGPTIEIMRSCGMTKNAPPLRTTNHHTIAPRTLVYHGARFDYIAAPGREISGVVRDQDTNTPLAGVRINGMAYDSGSSAFYAEIKSITDDRGRYRLLGLGQSSRYRLFVSPGKGQPYPTARFDESVGSSGPDPATIDLALKRGILVRGQLTDKSTGKPVKGSVVSYSLNDNPHVKDYPRFQGYEPRVYTESDGRFEIAALPGPGFLAARADTDSYLSSVGADTIPGLNPRTPFSARPGFFSPRNFHVIAGVNAAPGGDPITSNLQCDPGRTLSGRIVDPEGKPLAGVWTYGLKPFEGNRHPPLESDHFVATAIDPRQPRRLYFFHDERGLAGSVLTEGEQDGPIVVTLQPQGVITGRLLDDDGQPRKRLTLIDFMKPEFDPKEGVIVRECRVGDDGRFRLVVVPGLVYEAVAMSERNRTVGQVFKGLQVAPGETKDLGDVTFKKPPGQ